jgi:serine/threonine protein kinase
MLRLAPTSMIFARKLIRPFGSTKQDIENEVKAITGICATGGHQNIITILQHGPLRSTDYYFIDMELCEVNLADYISNSYDRTRLTDSSVGKSKSPVVVMRDCLLYEERENIYTIMHHIAAGLEFLHERKYAHRDLETT